MGFQVDKVLISRVVWNKKRHVYISFSHSLCFSLDLFVNFIAQSEFVPSARLIIGYTLFSQSRYKTEDFIARPFTFLPTTPSTASSQHFAPSFASLFPTPPSWFRFHYAYEFRVSASVISHHHHRKWGYHASFVMASSSFFLSFLPSGMELLSIPQPVIATR